jgi:hypothetical protein
LSESTDVALIAGVVGGGFVLLAVVVGVAIVIGLSRHRKNAASSSNDLPMTATAGSSSSSGASNYGVAPPPRDAPPVRTSEYGPLAASGEYASARVDSAYAAAVSVKGAETGYGAFTPAELQEE